MFGAIEIPFGCVMLFNAIKLKPGVTVDDVEMALEEMCNVVKNTYGDEKGGFVGDTPADAAAVDFGELAIVTYWRSFAQHEKSHADRVFKEKFAALVASCDATFELGYEMLWQGMSAD